MRRLKRVDSQAVQGEDTFVLLRPLTRREIREANERLDSKQMTFDESLDDLFRRSVIEWNWTGWDDEPLPQVPDNPEVVLELIPAEREFLLNALLLPDLKN